MAQDSALNFANGLLDAIPDSAALYLPARDLLMPNSRWKIDLGDMHRLADLAKLNVPVAELAAKFAGNSNSNEGVEFAFGAEAQSQFRLTISEVGNNSNTWLLFVRDETEVRRVEQMRKDFIANVSHELRTPLTAVKGYLETLLEPRFFTLDRVHEFLPIIFEHTERLHNLMLDLLSLSRLESPNTHIELSPLQLAEELDDAVKATAPLARMKNLEVRLTAPPEDLYVLANPEHIERILVNLLDNAIKYSHPNGKITIWTGVAGDHVWTHVQDEGPGIAIEELPRVFERFYRTRGALSGRARGSGLGLAIVKHIVQQLDGEIRVSSELGKGSNFYFSLKCAPRYKKPATEPGREKENQTA